MSIETMIYAARCLYERAYPARLVGGKIEFVTDGATCTIEDKGGKKYEVKGPGVSVTVDLSHLMGDNNGAALANGALRALDLKK